MNPKTRDKLAASIIVVVLLAFFLWRSGRPDLNQPGAMPAGGGPEDSVRTMFAAARDGRTADYLACFCESLRASLDDTARSMGDPKFREYIQGSAAPIMGMAFSDIAVRNATEATLRCELVFKDRNEVQRFALKRTGSRWLISAMTPAERIQPPVKYGTKVFE
jgi:hypothetical protein